MKHYEAKRRKFPHSKEKQMMRTELNRLRREYHLSGPALCAAMTVYVANSDDDINMAVQLMAMLDSKRSRANMTLRSKISDIEGILDIHAPRKHFEKHIETLNRLQSDKTQQEALDHAFDQYQRLYNYFSNSNQAAV